MTHIKLGVTSNNTPIPNATPVSHNRVLTVPFGVLFNKDSYYAWYDQIIKFLNLPGRLICFDYVKYYLSRQHPSIQPLLINYSKNL